MTPSCSIRHHTNFYIYLYHKDYILGLVEVAQQEKVLVAKPDDLGSIPRTQTRLLHIVL